MGIFKKEKEYEKSVDLEKLSDMIETYLKQDKWKIQSGKTENEGKIIQARKSGIIRDIFAADRALTIILSNTPKGIKVEMGVGKWLQNIGVTIVESLIAGIFLVIDVPEMLWNAEIENNILNKIDEFVEQISKETN
jgi:hypothetical protein